MKNIIRLKLPLKILQELCLINYNSAAFLSSGEKSFLQLGSRSSWLVFKWPLVFSSVHSLSRVRLFATPWTAAHQASLSITNSQSLPKPMSIESMMPSNHLILCRPLLLLPSILPNIRVFSNESALRIRWPKYWSFSFNISPSSEHPRLIFRMDWLALLTKHIILDSRSAQWNRERCYDNSDYLREQSSLLSFYLLTICLLD